MPQNTQKNILYIVMCIGALVCHIPNVAAEPAYARILLAQAESDDFLLEEENEYDEDFEFSYETSDTDIVVNSDGSFTVGSAGDHRRPREEPISNTHVPSASSTSSAVSAYPASPPQQEPFVRSPATRSPISAPVSPAPAFHITVPDHLFSETDPADELHSAPASISCPKPVSGEVPGAPVCNNAPYGWHVYAVLIAGAMLTGFGIGRIPRKKRATRAKRRRRSLRAAVLMPLAIGAASVALHEAHAENTVPNRRLYNSRLVAPDGTPITTAHEIRFSFWNTNDAQASDLLPNGDINTSSPYYLGWQEVHTFTPKANGAFSLEIGSISGLLNLSSVTAYNLRNLYQQIEIRPVGGSFQLLDPNPGNPLMDRSTTFTSVFARNADMLDRRDTGTASGSIPFLLSGGLLPVATIPGGTQRDFFIIDTDNSATQNIALQFGTALGKTLSYDTVLHRFSFNDDVYIDGDLIITGTINGADPTSFLQATLRVSNASGLSVQVASGSYKFADTLVSFGGSGNVVVDNNATTHLFMSVNGLQKSVSGLPSTEHIPLARVVTSGGAVVSIQDLRPLLTDDRTESPQIVALHPLFPGFAAKADGTANVGQLSLEHDDVAARNFYKWTSTDAASLQDYDIVLAVQLPAGFVRWDTSPLSVLYRTATGNAADAKADITMTDTAGQAVTLIGGSTGLANTSWTSSTLSYSGTPTWTAGQTAYIKVKLSAQGGHSAQIGTVTLRYITLQ